MTTDNHAAAVLATGLWGIIGWTVLGTVPDEPADEVWVIASSEKIASRPALIRASWTCLRQAQPDGGIPVSRDSAASFRSRVELCTSAVALR